VSVLAGRRPILTIHGGTDQVYFPRSKSRLAVPLFKFLFGAAKAVICDNPEVARCIFEYGVTPEKVFPISPFTAQYLEIPPRELDEDIEDFLNKHAPVVLTYVECRPEYDLESLFRAVEILGRRAPRLGLIVVGAASESETISRLLCATGINGRCLHLGAVDHSTFLSLLRRVSLFLRSAKTEGTSASIREALHLGVPVVANDAACHPRGVFVYPWGNVEAMAETAEVALAKSAVGEAPHTQPNVLDIPDTVAEEVEVLIRCAGFSPEAGRTRFQC
jgi:glycosyltransferase involved in cell wall biosynthesis